jgi:hypothetical protein
MAFVSVGLEAAPVEAFDPSISAVEFGGRATRDSQLRAIGESLN